jgi:hypothetical protein
LLSNPGIVRNRLKIASVVQNARAFLRVQEEYGSFDRYVWQFVNGRPKVNLAERQESGSSAHCGVGRDEQGSEEARLQFCGINHLLCLHAGGRNGG